MWCDTNESWKYTEGILVGLLLWCVRGLLPLFNPQHHWSDMKTTSSTILNGLLQCFILYETDFASVCIRNDHYKLVKKAEDDVRDELTTATSSFFYRLLHHPRLSHVLLVASGCCPPPDPPPQPPTPPTWICHILVFQRPQTTWDWAAQTAEFVHPETDIFTWQGTCLKGAEVLDAYYS